MRTSTNEDVDRSAAGSDSILPLAKRGLWLLPTYALLLALGTVTHQPDYGADFPAYARYVTTDVFLASHLLASILGGALGLLGVVAALGFLVRGAASRLAVYGAALTIAGNVVVAAVFGAAAFAQPAIGRAYRDGVTAIVAVNDDVYGAPLVATAVTGLLLLMAGAVMLGLAFRRTHPRLSWPGTAYAACLVVFVIAGFTLELAQPIAAALLVVATVMIARRLPDSVG